MAIPPIEGINGMDFKAIESEIENGGKFVMYQYVISVVILSFRQPSPIIFVKGGGSRIAKGFKYTAIAFLFGWWGIPWGILYTIGALGSNLTGSKDLTREVMAELATQQDRRDNRKKLADQRKQEQSAATAGA
ncbi:MAG: hypothetical protein H0W83_00265 [Planctomycetes bacterium]|nr:hypothetical protein [Planctomycetota bacterium]